MDTGAGLERMTTALQFVESGGKFASPCPRDLFAPITHAAAGLFGIQYDQVAASPAEPDRRKQFSINAIADHARALTFALSEGIVPSNEGRGYVLRRILRRALRFGYLLGAQEPFLHKLVEVVVDGMGGAYPEIKERPDHVAHVIRIEEERFIRTVAQGTKILDEQMARLREKGEATLGGDDAFLLHATYGFPVDLTAEILEDAGLSLDLAGYQRAMKAHQEEAKKSWKGGGGGAEAELLDDVFDKYGETEFLGYEGTESEARVVAILSGGRRVDEITGGQEALVVLEETPFYAESGGQVGDTGILRGEQGEFIVTDVRKTASGLFLHAGKAKGTIRLDDTVQAQVDAARRMAIRRNHTVAHLLQAALKQVVGKHITQSGSFVGPDGMRFDFSHTQACAPDELQRIERMVNEYILADLPVSVEEMPIEDARKKGAIAPFGEKYGHRVRVVEIGADAQRIGEGAQRSGGEGGHRGGDAGRVGGDAASRVSLEFCGGTHLERTGQIASFRLVAESSVAAGIRRIEGMTGLGAYEAWAATRDAAGALCRLLAVKETALGERVAALQDEIKKLHKEIKRAKQAGRSGGASIESLIAGAQEISGLKVVAAKLDEADAEQLRQTADQLREKVPNLVCVLGSVAEGKLSLLCAVS
ncbi:MAG: alanine--tRNA ligase, partial [Acidobacteria bacterium]|nr:alanine--tRNA ligase [Acidobacteriota bacterium]